jgi:DNA-binding transcriptional regulator YhcF (GntR family)
MSEELSPAARALHEHLLSLDENAQGATVFPSIRALAERSATSEQRTRQALGELEQAGYLSKAEERPSGSALWLVHPKR